ncbi:MAG TPA: hypothetical protein VIJ60_02115 [Acidimicrobiales bacterium]
MTSLTHLSATTGVLSSDDDLCALVEGICQSRGPVHLDLEAFDLDSPQRLDPLRLYILSNVCLNAPRGHIRRLTLPAGDNARLALMRSGLLFGIFSRSTIGASDTPTIDGLGNASLHLWIELWSHPWSPMEPAVGRLFEEDEPRLMDSKDFAGPNGAFANASNAKKATRVVVDPHRRSRRLLQSRSNQGLAGRWLNLVTPTSQDSDLRAHRRTWRSVVAGRVLVEPLLNLVDHAIKCPEGAGRRRDIRSLALLARTEGGGTESHPRLQMLIADNGYGLVETLRPKLRQSSDNAERDRADQSALDVLRFAATRPACTAKDPGLPWSRSGFEVAVDEAQHSKKLEGVMEDRSIGYAPDEFSIISGDPDNENRTIWVRMRRNDAPESGSVEGVPFIGTTVFATIPMPTSGLPSTRIAVDDAACSI